MGIISFIKRKELLEIDLLKTENEQQRLEIIQLKNTCEELSTYKEILSLDKYKDSLKLEISKLEDEISVGKSVLHGLQSNIGKKKKQIVELDDTILLQEFGIYSPIYDFASSEQYRDRLDVTRAEQKRMILEKTAATCPTNWTVNGSEAQGRAMTNDNIKQILRCFNNECDVLISKVKFNNIESYKDKIWKCYEQLNRMNKRNGVSISIEYVQLKIDEINLAYEYAVKKQEEKEEQKRIREQLREEAKLQKEIEEARKDIEKELKHYSNALSKLDKQLESCSEVEREIILEKRKDIESHLGDLEVAIKDIDYREANKKAGYVYVISNIGSFGEHVYKIGMTRRLDPMERVDELGDASVPFKFDVHALIFSDDAPSLESALHRAFENNKVNMINGRREFFKVTLDEIEQVVKDNYDKTVDFNKIPEAEQFRESLKMLQMLDNKINV